MPNHWTKIGGAELADSKDRVFYDSATGTTYVLGHAHKNATKEEIASWYGVSADDVTFPLEEA